MSKSNFKLIPVGEIKVSLTNPRKHFDDSTLAELSESIKEHGVLQPILVRPIPPLDTSKVKYELVCGERRFRASKLAGLTEIPAMVKELTHIEAFEAQILENLQREDVSPLDEARAFSSLMQKETIDWLASKINKSKKYVLDRIKLLDLCDYAMEALEIGVLPLGHAVLLSKIDKQKQEVILKKDFFYGGIKDLETNKWKDLSKCHCTKTHSQLKQIIQSEVMLSFDRVNFDLNDAELLPKAGACQTCPKRTINENLLFGDITESDMCTDNFCFKEKMKAQVLNNATKAIKELGCPVAMVEKDQWSSHTARVKRDNGKIESVRFNDEKTEQFTEPAIIEKTDAYSQKDLGKLVWLEKIDDKQKETETKPNVGNWDLKKAIQIDEVIIPRMELFFDLIQKIDTSEALKHFIHERLQNMNSIHAIVMAKLLHLDIEEIKDIALEGSVIRDFSGALGYDSREQLLGKIAGVIINEWPIPFCLNLIAIDNIIDGEFEDDDDDGNVQRDPWEFTIDKYYKGLGINQANEVDVIDAVIESEEVTQDTPAKRIKDKAKEIASKK